MRIIAFVIAGAALLAAADPTDFAIWKGSELKESGKKLAPKINAQKVATESLGNWGNHNLMVAHREGSGEAELHETQADVFIVQSGEASLVVGGTVVDPKTTAPHEIRGPSIKDGVTKQLGAGDIVHIAAKTPHQLIVAKGKQITYAVVKVDLPATALAGGR
jgi:mannose-6-phosphate isomerase-like protein (cupin superfamily)